MRGVAVSPEGRNRPEWASAWAITTLDGHLDIFKTHFQRQPSGLYHNSGKAEFEDVTVKTGINNENRYVSWGAGIVDLDNDGYPDLFLVTGNVYPELEKVFPQLPYNSPRIIFRNLGNGRFAELVDDAGPGIAARHRQPRLRLRRFR